MMDLSCAKRLHEKIKTTPFELVEDALLKQIEIENPKFGNARYPFFRKEKALQRSPLNKEFFPKIPFSVGFGLF